MSDQHEALLKDVMAMANGSVNGERLIVIGVKHRAAGSREYLPIPKEQFVDAAIYQQLVRENIEPELEIEYFPYAFGQSLLGILRIARADDPPHMLRKDFGKLRRGECLVRKGTHQHRACRDDLNRYFKETSREHFDRSLRLGFLDQNYAGTLDYRIRKFDWPSDLARQRIEAVLASKRARAAHLGRTLSSLELTLAGKPLPFEHRSIEALEQSLKTVNADFEGSDYHAAFLNALELNIELLNDADEYLVDASLELTIPRREGLFVFDRICHPPDAEGWVRALQTDYPEVDNRAGEYCIRAPLGDLKHKNPHHRLRRSAANRPRARN